MPDLTFIDTSVLVRYLTKDPPHLAEAAAHVIAKTSPLYVSETALAETAHVLRCVYEVERSIIIDLLQRLVRDDGLLPHPSGAGKVLDGLELCRPSGKVSIPDALIWAAAASTGQGAAVYTFDRRFPSAGIRVLELPE